MRDSLERQATFTEACMYKRCSKCKLEKPVSEFYAHTKRAYQSACKPCSLEMLRQHRIRRGVYVKVQSDKDLPWQYETAWLKLRRGPCIASALGVDDPRMIVSCLRHRFGVEIGSRKVKVQTKFGSVKATEYFLKSGTSFASPLVEN
jgi:hypothetical protein